MPIARCDDCHQQKDAVVTQEIADGDQHDRQPGQIPAGIGKYAHDLGYDVNKHAADNQQCENRKHDRIDHRVLNLLSQHLPALRVVGQSLEHGIQVSGLFARRNRGPIDFRECLRKITESVGQGMSFHDP